MIHKNTKGFTLIEVLVAISIISIITIVFYTSTNNAIKHNKKNEVDIHSMNVAQSVLEEIRVYAKKNKSIGIDINSDGVEDFNIINDSSSWSENVYNKNIEKIEVSNESVVYEIIISKLAREMDNNDVYTIELQVKPSNSSKKVSKIVTQIYAR